MSRKEKEKAAAALGSDAAFAEARCFVISAGCEYKRRERAQHAAVVLHSPAADGAHPCVAWASTAAALFQRCVQPAALDAVHALL